MPQPLPLPTLLRQQLALLLLAPMSTLLLAPMSALTLLLVPWPMPLAQHQHQLQLKPMINCGKKHRLPPAIAASAELPWQRAVKGLLNCAP